MDRIFQPVLIFIAAAFLVSLAACQPKDARLESLRSVIDPGAMAHPAQMP